MRYGEAEEVGSYPECCASVYWAKVSSENSGNLAGMNEERVTLSEGYLTLHSYYGIIARDLIL